MPDSVSTGRPLRLSFMTHLAGLADAPRVYRDALELFRIAEQLGFSTGWVAQHHLTRANGWLPSPLVFLAAAAGRTEHLRLGTAVVTLPLEHPLRVAEDAVVTDLISGGRLELGLGHGGDRPSYRAFGVSMEDKRGVYDANLARLRSALRGAPIVDDRPLEPSASDLDARLWQGSSSAAGAAQVAHQGLGLLVARAVFATDLTTARAQRPIVDSYRDAWTGSGAGRVGVSRAVYPGRTREQAVAQVETGLLHYVRRLVDQGRYPAGASTEDYLRLQNVHLGEVDDVVEGLAADETVAVSDELICQLQPGLPSLGEAVSALELIAQEVAPRLGRPRTAGAP